MFFYNSGTHWASAAGCAVYAWGGDATNEFDSKITQEGTYYHFTWFQDDNGHYYGFADIPTNVTGYKIAKLSNSEYVTTESYSSTNSFNIDSFAYVRYGQGDGNYISSGGADGDVAGASLMKKVIEAYNTCSNSTLNGYGAYNALNTNFYSHATAAAKSATHASLNGHTTTIQAHFEGMASRVGRAGSSGSLLIGIVNEKTHSVAIIVIISLVSVTAIGGYFFIRRRKENI